MLSRLVRSTIKSFGHSSKFAFASASQGGNLYTWGDRSAGLGLESISGSEETRSPQRVEGFQNNVVKVAMGPSHTAVITTDGELYTFGYGAHGVLGHGDSNVHTFTPQIVQFFQENNIRVKDVAVGNHHTAVLTEKGEVYTWGFGGKSLNLLKNIFAPSFGALGLGVSADRNEPALIEDANFGKGALASGSNFVAVLNDKKEIYNWGVGKGAVFAEESQRNIKLPTLNEAVKHLVEEEGSQISKIKAAGNHVLVLLENGTLWGWGDNELGQLGIPKEVGIEINHEVDHPTKLNTEEIGDKKVVDFDSGEEISVILTEDGEAYWFGLKLALDPERINLPKGVKAKSVAVANPYYIVVTENNEIYANTQIIANAQYDPLTGLYRVKADNFQGGQILEVGGPYVNRYAIVKN